MTSAAELRSLSVREYHRMVEVEILAADERVKLIEGQLYTMAAKGTAHSAAVTRIDRALSQRLTGRALLRFQDPVQLGVAHVWYDRDVIPIQPEYDLSRMPV